MTLLRREYAAEIFTRLGIHGLAVRHLLLHAETSTLAHRIAAHEMFPDDPQRNEKARAFRTYKLPDYRFAHHDWLHDATEVIDTTGLTTDEVLAHALQLLNLA
jgi:hypothetical protein